MVLEDDVSNGKQMATDDKTSIEEYATVDKA